MKENNKTITTQLTHDIIKKDFFALHFGFINLLWLAFCIVVLAITIPLSFTVISFGSILLSVLFCLPVFLLTVIFGVHIITLISQTVGILSQKYTIVTDRIADRKDRYSFYAKQLLIGRSPFFFGNTDNLTFEENGSFRLQRHTYYAWSPMFELTDQQIFEHAQKGTPYHLVLCGKSIVMIYNTENFLLEN